MLRTRSYIPYLFLTPATLLLLFVFGYPLAAIFDFSTRRIRGASGAFIGLENYRQVLDDPIFSLSVRHNAQLLLAVPLLLIISLLLAVILDDRIRGWRFYRSTLFFPYVLAVPIVGAIFSNLLQYNGVINTLLRDVGFDFLALDWIGNRYITLWTIMLITIWHNAGFGIILFLARLQSLNEEIKDAAKVDGAGWWQRLWYVTIPQLKDVMEFYIVITIITMLAWVFPYIYVVSRGGPGNATQVLEYYIYNSAFRYSAPGPASAVAVMLFIITLVLIVPYFVIRRESD